MTDKTNTPPNPKNGNPYAASVRLKSRTMTQAYGQRRHDLRMGSQPQYVDQSRMHLNRVLIEPRSLPSIRDEIIELRKGRGAQRALKKNASILKSGIITFGTEAAKLFSALPADQQDAAFIELAQILADRLETRVESLVVHLDETTIHAHFDLRAFSDDGQPICASMDRKALAEFQDITAKIMQRYCPDIQRGHRKQDRLDAGADYIDTLNMSVRELHEALPDEIAAKRLELDALDADIASRYASIATDQARIEKLEAKEALSAKEAKRLEKYNVRLEKKERDLQAVKDSQSRVAVELRHSETSLAQQNAQNANTARQLQTQMAKAEQERTEATQALAKAQADKKTSEIALTAVETLVEAMANDSIEKRPEGIHFDNPKPILVAPKPLQNRLKDIINRHIDMQLEWEKKFAWLDAMIGKVKSWLGRDDLTEEARQNATSVVQQYDKFPEND